MSNESLSSRRVSTMSWRVILQLISVVVAVEIALHSFIVKEPLFTLVSVAVALFTVVMTIVSERTPPHAQAIPGKHPREASP
jgi:hypothetical protein